MRLQLDGLRRRTLALAAASGTVVVAVRASAAILGFPLMGLPAANPRALSPTAISSGYSLALVAEGSAPLENPSGPITRFGYLNDFPPQTVEPTKTEPDENLYLDLDHSPGGPTAGYDYGRHFLFQGHENGGDLGYITRINLDVGDPAHRITLLTPVGSDGKTHLNSIDGSAYDPFSKTLLFTQEAGAGGGAVQLSVDFPSTVTSLDGIVGKGGYEGIKLDDHGNIYLIEDAGGVSVNANPADPTSPKVAKQPNSFVYRFLPNNPHDLTAGGRLQALQVFVAGVPVLFNAADPVGDTFSAAQLALHTPGTSYPTRWVTVHDTAVDGTAAFSANAAAKTAGATPFKRPENMAWLPGSNFRTFFFCPTGDTDTRSGSVPELAARGAWGSIFRLDLLRDGGRLSLFFLGDKDHASFDNLAFLNPGTLVATEDRGDTLHRQLDALDSIWAFDALSSQGPDPRRFVALGRDSASSVDVALGEASTPGFQNEGDNEPTGLFFSEGATSIGRMLGTVQNPERSRGFFTQQHGENRVYEILKTPDCRHE
jgi:hypothetical protein